MKNPILNKLQKAGGIVGRMTEDDLDRFLSKKTENKTDRDLQDLVRLQKTYDLFSKEEYEYLKKRIQIRSKFKPMGK